MASERQLFSGRFSDGTSARSLVVHGEMRANELVFWPADGETADGATGGQRQTWAYTALTTNDPIRHGDADVLVHCADAPGATLFVEDRAFLRSLAERAEQTSRRAWFWRFTRPALAILATLVAIASAVYVFDLSPTRAVAKMIPKDVHEQIGTSLLKSLTENRRTCSTADGDAALDVMKARLTPPGRAPYRTRVIDWSLENAFALPGGQIVLTRGLVTNAASAEEVTGVLAHEIGHIEKRHPETAVVRALGFTVAAQFIFAGGAETLGSIGTALVALRYTRSAEREADRIALQLLKKTAVDPKPLAGFFTRKMAKHGHSGGAKKQPGETDDAYRKRQKFEKQVETSLELLSTHPPSEERVKQILASAGHATRPVMTASQWKALQTICTKGDTGAADKPDDN